MKVPFGSLPGVSESSPVAEAIQGFNPCTSLDAGRARELQKCAQPATQMLSVHCLYQSPTKSASPNRFFRTNVYREGAGLCWVDQGVTRFFPFRFEAYIASSAALTSISAVASSIRSVPTYADAGCYRDVSTWLRFRYCSTNSLCSHKRFLRREIPERNGKLISAPAVKPTLPT